MLDGYRAAVPAAAQIGTLVNTHSNGDHTFGNQLVAGARIVASRACAEEMAQHTPEKRSAMMRNWRDYGEAGAAWHDLYDGIFDFEGLVHTPPTETFERELKLRVGAREVWDGSPAVRTGMVDLGELPSPARAPASRRAFNTFVYTVLRADAVDVVYSTVEGYEMLGVPYMPHIAPERRW